MHKHIYIHSRASIFCCTLYSISYSSDFCFLFFVFFSFWILLSFRLFVEVICAVSSISDNIVKPCTNTNNSKRMRRQRLKSPHIFIHAFDDNTEQNGIPFFFFSSSFSSFLFRRLKILFSFHNRELYMNFMWK